MTSPAPRWPTLELARFAWPAAFVAVAALGFAAVRDLKPAPASEVRIEHPTPTVLKDLRELARLETLSLHVEKVVDVKDHQQRLYGFVEAEDALLFVATGEVVLGVDLGKLREQDVRWDEASRTAYVTVPPVEILSTHFDEAHSYVHARKTDVLAKRNEALESLARRDALVAFEVAAKDPKAQARAQEQAEKQLTALAKGWGARSVVVTFQAGKAATPEAAIVD